MYKLSIIITTFILFACQKEIKKPNQQISQHTILQDGDIIFQNSQSSQSKAIELATHSNYSHMGIIYTKNNAYYVLEASNVVKLTPLDIWIQHGDKQEYVVKRLKNEKLLTQKTLQQLKLKGEEHLGKSYDLYFEWTDKKMYCSELVWKLYKNVLDIEIGKPKHLNEFDLNNSIVQNKLNERFGNKIPLQETVISPQDMFESKELIDVFYSN